MAQISYLISVITAEYGWIESN